LGSRAETGMSRKIRTGYKRRGWVITRGLHGTCPLTAGTVVHSGKDSAIVEELGGRVNCGLDSQHDSRSA